MSVLSSDENDLFDIAKGAIPSVMFQDEMSQELIAAFAKIFGASRVQMDAWLAETYILDADGFWLDQLALDRNYRRQVGESDAALAQRIRTFADCVTPAALLALVNAALAAQSLGTGYLVEVRRDKAYVSTGYVRITLPAKALLADGDHFTLDSNAYEFDTNGAVSGGRTAIDISAAVTASDVAQATLAAITAHYPTSGVPQLGTCADVIVEGVTTWTEVVTETTFTINSEHFAYLSRGYRIGKNRVPRIIVILPYGTDSGTSMGILDILQRNKAGGVAVSVEVNQVP